MSKKWDRIAAKEFEALEKEAQKDWADLRDKVSRRSLNSNSK
jgi:hypothetical protein